MYKMCNFEFAEVLVQRKIQKIPNKNIYVYYGDNFIYFSFQDNSNFDDYVNVMKIFKEIIDHFIKTYEWDSIEYKFNINNINFLNINDIKLDLTNEFESKILFNSTNESIELISYLSVHWIESCDFDN